MTASGGKSQTSGDGRAAASTDDTVRGALETVPAVTQGGMLLLDMQGLITRINAEARYMLHCWLPDVAGRDFWDVVPERLAEQHQAVTRQALASWSQHHFTANSEFQDDWIEPKSGSYPVAISCSSASQGGKGLVIFATT